MLLKYIWAEDTERSEDKKLPHLLKDLQSTSLECTKGDLSWDKRQSGGIKLSGFLIEILTLLQDIYPMFS